MRPGASIHLGAPLLAGLALALGVLYALVVQAGLPYDEPSHWATVLYYANHHRLPVLGSPGVTYEAQMGPVAYTLDAILFHLAHGAGSSTETAFHVVRLVGVAEFVVVVIIVGELVKLLVPWTWASVAALAVFALNPMLLAMSSSVQNDTLALLLGLLAVMIVLTRLDVRPEAGWALVAGTVAGLAVLTKLTAWAVVVVVPIWLAWRYRGAAVKAIGSFVAAALVVSGWWFVRNIELYGDPTAAAGVRRTGVSFAPYRLHGLHGIWHLVEELVTYLWLPTEYVRNSISAPTPLKAILFLVTLTVLASAATRLTRFKHSAGTLVALVAVAALGAWLVTDLTSQAVAPRVAYMALPVWVAILALAWQRVSVRLLTPVVAIGLAALNAWTLYQLYEVPQHGFIAF